MISGPGPPGPRRGRSRRVRQLLHDPSSHKCRLAGGLRTRLDQTAFQRALHRLASSAGAELAIDGLRLAPDGMHGDDELFTDLAKRVMRR